MTLTFELDLNSVKLNQHVRLSRSFDSTYRLDTQTHRQWSDCSVRATKVIHKCSVLRWRQFICCMFCVVDLFHFFAIAQKFGGYDKVTAVLYCNLQCFIVAHFIFCVIVLLCKSNSWLMPQTFYKYDKSTVHQQDGNINCIIFDFKII